jgi:hypothetical protein
MSARVRQWTPAEFPRDRRRDVILWTSHSASPRSRGRREPRDHKVVQHAARLVQQLRVARAVLRQAQKIGRHEPFERLRCARARQNRLAHVRHVEQARAFARPSVFGEHAGGIVVERILRRFRADHAHEERPGGADGRPCSGNARLRKRTALNRRARNRKTR